MIPLLSDIESQNSSWAAMCLMFGTELGLDTPVPDCVLRRARADDKYARRLIICRGSDKLLSAALTDPENAAFVRESDTTDHRLATLCRRVTGSIARWVTQGARVANLELQKSRLDICNSCSNLREAPDRVVYKIALIGTRDSRICNMCGCPVARKALLSTEACPLKLW